VKVVIRLKPEEESKFSRCVFLSELENQLMVETDLKKEVFLFDHVAHQFTNQSDIYKLIGKDAVATSFEVPPPPRRASTAASSPTGRREPARPTRSWETRMPCSETCTARAGASCRG
jgi:hypothetical protein